MRYILLLLCLFTAPCLAVDRELTEVHPWEKKPYIRWKDDNGRWHVEPNPFEVEIPAKPEENQTCRSNSSKT